MKYNINRNQEPLTEEDFSSARDFSKVLKGYRSIKKPFYRTGRFLTSGSAIVVAAAIGLIVLFNEPQEPAKSFISPPLAQAIIPLDSFSIYADSATEITYKTGSEIHIPAGAFKDANGNPVQGKVTLKYREFHDQKDIFLSGIPMTYDSAGTKYVFESAGMMEISASQNGKPLLPNPDKTIKVDMVSNTAEDRYNTYYLDTVAKKWVNLNQANLDTRQISVSNSLFGDSASSDRPIPESANPLIAKCEEQLRKTEAVVKGVEKQKPMPVIKADDTKTKFHIVVDSSEFPEIAMYKGVHFQVKNEKNFDMNSAKVQWEDVKLKKLNGMDYQVTFSKGDRTFQIIANPVVEDKDLPAAKKIYDQKYAEYQAKLEEKKAAEEKAKMEYEARLKEEKAQMEKAMADQEAMNRIYEARMTKTELVYRTFSVNAFGIYNCDCPGIWPSEANVIATCTSENGEELNLSCLNLVEKGVNAVFPYQMHNSECSHFKFDPSQKNMLWAMTSDNKLAIVDVNSFKAQQSKTGKVQFRFKVIDKDFKSSDEVKKYLEI